MSFLTLIGLMGYGFSLKHITSIFLKDLTRMVVQSCKKNEIFNSRKHDKISREQHLTLVTTCSE